MNLPKIKSIAVAASLAAFAVSTSWAQIQLTPNFSTSGFISGSILYHSTGDPETTIDLDAAQLTFNGSFDTVSGTVSLYYVPGAPEDVTVLDAYIGWQVSDDVTVTMGKFLSYMGFEAFYIPSLYQISYANGDFLGAIPGYHDGVRLDFGGDGLNVGIAILDSVYSPNYLRGDGEFSDQFCVEGYVSFSPTEGSTIFAGIAHDGEGGFQAESVTMFNLWGSFTATDSLWFAAEITHKDGGDFNTGYNWLLFANWTQSDLMSWTFRVSGEEMDEVGTAGGEGFLRYTVSPTFAVAENLAILLEGSFTDFNEAAGGDSDTFFGVNAILSW
jgi:hypothetical protein